MWHHGTAFSSIQLQERTYPTVDGKFSAFILKNRYRFYEDLLGHNLLLDYHNLLLAIKLLRDHVLHSISTKYGTQSYCIEQTV